MASVYQEHVRGMAEYRRQGWTANFAFTRAVVVMISKASMICRCGGLYVSASSWQDPPTGPTLWNTVREPPDRNT